MSFSPRISPQHGLPSATVDTPPIDNDLLAALGVDEWRRWQPHLVPVELSAGQVLCESGSIPAFVYFPRTALVSMLYLTLDGASTEYAVVGDEGLVGIPVFMGGNAMPGRAVVQSAGSAWRIGAAAVRREALLAGPLLASLLRYTQALIAQVAQTAICNRFHSIDEQLSRRLLLALDRCDGDELRMTQEGMAQLLGVRREGVTAAALKLQEAGVIRYRRGRIQVLDRERLEQHSCECYGVVRDEGARLTVPRQRVPEPDCCSV